MFLVQLEISFNAPTIDILSRESALVNWVVPNELANKEGVAFTVLYKSDQSPLWNKLAATNSSLQIDNLKPDLSYLFRVDATLPDGTVFSSEQTSPILLTGRNFLLFFIL
jgi:hypothetical protein